MSSLSTEASLEDVKVITSVLCSIAIVVTSFRLFDRARLRKLWWDDAWAFISMIFIVIYMAAVLLHIRDPATLTRNVKIGVYYMCAQFFYAVSWSARISILFTVIRICPTGPLRSFLGILAAAFLVAWAVLFAQVWWVCEAEPNWKNNAIPQCDLGENVAIAQVICDVISDAILIFTPIQLIKGVRLSRTRKIQLISVFSTTVITTAVSLFHAFAVLRVGGFFEAMAASIQTSVSLIIANLTVVVAFLVGVALRMQPEEAESNRQPLFIHSNGMRKRNRKADPLRSLTTFEGTFGGIKTIVETDCDSDFTKTNTKSTDTLKASADKQASKKDLLGAEPETYKLSNLSHAGQSTTMVDNN